ncbi:MAG: winged helix-turn-helix transcriptional regulator [Methanothrix sp.]|nr:winged helix-turn-helix transcriptional regulator [Methanothrix sp.]HQI68697.1 winged helix-turn-helix transcriptional regulator [Methanothrix sp.]HRT17665.1 winged helix-turn-helix transcriptional regulator [Methanothrix sp.]
MSEGMRCQNCGREISGDEVFATEGKTLCEDCYIDAGHRIRVCDPWAERSKKIFRDSHGLQGTDGLTDLQKQIYEFIRERGRATRAELAERFNLSPTELENEFAILRHCQLLKGRKEGDTVYIVPW